MIEVEEEGSATARASAGAGPPPSPVVAALATTAVKGLRLHARSEIVLERTGVAGNRLFYLIDERGTLVNGKRIGALTAGGADYEPGTEVLTMSFPDGAEASGRVELGDAIETRFFSRSPTVRLVAGPWSEALSHYAGRRLRLVRADPDLGGGVDRGLGGTVSLISRESVTRLEEIAGGRTVDSRRFRMLIEIAGVDAHEEDEWIGREVRIGDALVAMRGNVGRCRVTTMDPDTGMVDLPTLDLLSSYRGELDSSEPLAFGIYGEVLEPGTVRVGDRARPA